MQLPFKNALEVQSYDNEKKVAYFKPFSPYDVHPDDRLGSYIVTPEAIENCAHEFAKNIRIIGIDHERLAASSLVENTISRGGYKFKNSSIPIPDGAWVVGIKIENDELWNDIKSGKISGISPAGMFQNGYYDENSGRFIITDLKCKELSLMKNKTPLNNTPMLYANAKEGDESMEDPKTQEKTNEPESKPETTPEVKYQDPQKDPYENFNKTMSKLNENIQANTEAVLKSDPDYEKNMQIQERKQLIESLSKSNDPAAKSLLAQLQNQNADPNAPKVVGEGFDMNNLQTTDAANAYGVGSQENKEPALPGPGIPPDQTQIPQKKSPDLFIDPNARIQQQMGQKPIEIPKELKEKADAIDKKYQENRTLDPWDKFNEVNELASSYNTTQGVRK